MSTYERLREKYKDELKRGLKTTNKKIDLNTEWTKEDEKKNQELLEWDRRETALGNVVVVDTIKRIDIEKKGIDYEDE